MIAVPPIVLSCDLGILMMSRDRERRPSQVDLDGQCSTATQSCRHFAASRLGQVAADRLRICCVERCEYLQVFLVEWHASVGTAIGFGRHETDKYDSWMWQDKACVCAARSRWMLHITDRSRHCVIEHFQTRQSDLPDATPVAYFYCSGATGEPERRSAAVILQSLVKQLSLIAKGSVIRAPTAEAFKDRQSQARELGTDLAALTTEECTELIIELSDNSPAIIVIDAADECAVEQRRVLLSALTQATEQARDVVKVVIISRHEEDIGAYLGSAVHKIIRREDTKKDITNFVNVRVREFIQEWSRLHGDRENAFTKLEGNMIAAFEEGAHGMSVFPKYHMSRLLTGAGFYGSPFSSNACEIATSSR